AGDTRRASSGSSARPSEPPRNPSPRNPSPRNASPRNASPRNALQPPEEGGSPVAAVRPQPRSLPLGLGRGVGSVTPAHGGGGRGVLMCGRRRGRDLTAALDAEQGAVRINGSVRSQRADAI